MKNTDKFKRATAKFIHEYFNTHRTKFNNTWSSSALTLQNRLSELGVVLPRKLYYEYKFPNGLNNQTFNELEYVSWLQQCVQIYENYLVYCSLSAAEIKARLLHMIPKETIKTDLSSFFGFCICLALSKQQYVIQQFKQSYDIAQQHVLLIAEEIRHLNPELQNIKYYQNIDFIEGAAYGFAPEEINFFTTLRERRKGRINAHEYEAQGKDQEVNHVKHNQQIIEEFISPVLVTYFLSPQTSDTIVKAINEHRIKLQHIQKSRF